MTDQQRATWNTVRANGKLRYLILRGLQYGVLLGLAMLLADYVTRGQWRGWRSELLFLVPYALILGDAIAFVQWRTAERRYELEPASSQEVAAALERENSRLRGFVLLCLAVVFILLSFLLRGCPKT